MNKLTNTSVVARRGKKREEITQEVATSDIITIPFEKIIIYAGSNNIEHDPPDFFIQKYVTLLRTLYNKNQKTKFGIVSLIPRPVTHHL